MNLIAFLKRLVLKIKENHYTKSETEKLVDDKIKNQIPGAIDVTSNIEVKTLTASQTVIAKNLDLSYTAEDGVTKKQGKVKSDVTPYDDETYNLGSSSKAYKNAYLSRNGLKFRSKIPDPSNPGRFLNITPMALDDEGKLQIYFPGVEKHKAVTITPDGKITIYNPKTYLKAFEIDGTYFTMFGSRGKDEVQKKPFSFHSDLHRFDLENFKAMLATHSEFIIIPDHGIFDELYVDVSSYDRIKIGGAETLGFDQDGSIVEDVIFSYKKAGQSTDDIPDFAITKKGDIYYKGKLLDDLLNSGSSKLYLYFVRAENGYLGTWITLTFYTSKILNFNSFSDVCKYLKAPPDDGLTPQAEIKWFNTMNVYDGYGGTYSIQGNDSDGYYMRVNCNDFIEGDITDGSGNTQWYTHPWFHTHDFDYRPNEENANYLNVTYKEM